MREVLRKFAIQIGIDDSLRDVIVQSRLLGERARWAVSGEASPSDAVLLVGSGRSGTTWLTDALSRCRGVQQIFEPLHAVRVPEVQKLTHWAESGHPHIRSHYLRATDQDPRWHDLIERILTGRVRNYWTDYLRTSYFPTTYLVKLIRANLMLGYIHDNFAPRIIYVVRHPCAVVASRLQVRWHADVGDILRQEALVEDHLQPWVAEIEQEKDLLGAHAVWWAVENLVAIRDLESRPHQFVHYEAVALQPYQEFGRICDWLGIDREDIPMERIRDPSRMARTQTPHEASLERLGSWRNRLSPAEQRRVLDWAHRVGLSWYDDGPLPATITPPPEAEAEATENSEPGR